MRTSSHVSCSSLPCAGVQHANLSIPDREIDPAFVRMILVSEAAPADPADGYYAAGDPLFLRTTLLAFRDAGCEVETLDDLLAQGVYLTTAIKCGKLGYAVPTTAVNECSRLLEQELAFFPNARILLLMGDVAIRAVNQIARRNREPRAVPAGSTYKIRGPEYTFRGMRVFPSYLQAGPAFFIEKSKRQMIAEDIRAALSVLEH